MIHSTDLIAKTILNVLTLIVFRKILWLLWSSVLLPLGLMQSSPFAVTSSRLLEGFFFHTPVLPFSQSGAWLPHDQTESSGLSNIRAAAPFSQAVDGPDLKVLSDDLDDCLQSM